MFDKGEEFAVQDVNMFLDLKSYVLLIFFCSEFFGHF